MNPARIVVDTNILFSLLLRGETALRKRFLTDNAPTFHCPRFVFVELFQHKERIAQATELSEEDLLECLYELLARVHFLEEAAILIMDHIGPPGEGTRPTRGRYCGNVGRVPSPGGGWPRS